MAKRIVRGTFMIQDAGLVPLEDLAARVETAILQWNGGGLIRGCEFSDVTPLGVLPSPQKLAALAEFAQTVSQPPEPPQNAPATPLKTEPMTGKPFVLKGGDSMTVSILPELDANGNPILRGAIERSPEPPRISTESPQDAPATAGPSQKPSPEPSPVAGKWTPETWEEAIGGRQREEYIVKGIKRHLRTPAHRAALSRMDKSIEDLLNGRYGDPERAKVNKIFQEWNATLGWEEFRGL